MQYLTAYKLRTTMSMSKLFMLLSIILATITTSNQCRVLQSRQVKVQCLRDELPN